MNSGNTLAAALGHGRRLLADLGQRQIGELPELVGGLVIIVAAVICGLVLQELDVIAGSMSPPSDIDTSATATAAVSKYLLLEPMTLISTHSR